MTEITPMHLNLVLEDELLLIRQLTSSGPASRCELASTPGLADACLSQTVARLLRSGAISATAQGMLRYEVNSVRVRELLDENWDLLNVTRPNGHVA